MKVELGLDLQSGHWWVNGQPPRAFADTPEGRAELKHYLHHLGTQSACILVSGERIEYHLEPIPALNTRDRRALLAQRLQKFWPDHPLKRGGFIDTGGQSRLLMAAMALGPALQQGLALLADLQIPVAGVFDLGELRVQQQGSLPPQSLVIYAHEGRLDQYWVVKGQVCFARLSPYEDLVSAGIRELPRILAHLQSEGQLEGPQPLAVQARVPVESTKACRQAWASLPGIHLILHPETYRENPLAEALTALPKLKGLPQYGSAAMLRPYRRRRYLGLLTRGGLLVALGLTLFGAWQFHQLQTFRALGEAEKLTQASIQHPLDSAAKEAPPLPLPLADLQEIQQQRLLLLAPQHTLARQWPRAKGILHSQPHFKLEALRWQHATGLNLKGQVEGSSPRDALGHYQMLQNRLRTIAPLRALADPLAATPDQGWSKGTRHQGDPGRLPFEFLLQGKDKP